MTTAAASGVVEPRALGLSEPGLQRLRDALRREVDAKRVPGGVALIARRGRIGFFEAFGVHDPATGAPMPLDALFRIYSMTKPVASVAVMMLAEEGRMTLIDPLSAYVPAFDGVKVAIQRAGDGFDLVDPERPIAIYDLLRHTSGLTYEFEDGSPVPALYQRANVARERQTNAEHADLLATLPLRSHPGREWNYSRSTDVLGRVVEVVSSRTLGEFLRERIFAPLGMHDTFFSVPDDRQHRLAEAFASDPDTGEPVSLLNRRRPVRFESGGGGLTSTAADYARFLEMLRAGGALDGRRLLARKTVELMTSDHLSPGVTIGAALEPGHGFGLGFSVRRARGLASIPGSPGTYSWDGAAGTTFWVDPAEDLAAILMIQAPRRGRYFWSLFRSLAYAALE